MLTTLTLKYFRKHEDLTINFSRGLNALRGPNESGKSTLQEAILYAYYGAKTLRNPLADTVTWGHKEGELKVQLVHRADGKDYTFERSKGGATVYLEGKPFVTGQNEVTAFAAQLLGADAKIAAMLMLATQADLRGAMDEGPTAVSGLIAKLADFDTVDLLLTRAAERLLTGSEAPFAQRLEQAQQQLANIGEEPKLSGHDVAAGAARALYDEKVATIPGLQQAVSDADEGLTWARRHNENVERIQKELADLRQRAQARGERIQTLDAIISAAPTPTAIAAADAALAQARDAGTLAKYYGKVQALPPYPAEFWDADKASFYAEMSDLVKKTQVATGEVASLEGQIRSTKARKITNGKCPTCGSTKNSDEHVAAHNAAVQVEIDALERNLAMARAVQSGHNESLEALRCLEGIAQPFLTLASELAAVDLPVSVDEKVFPPVIHWVGEAPDATLLPKAQAARDALARQERATAQAEGERRTLQADIETIGLQTLQLEQTLQTTPLKDPAPWLEALSLAQGQLHNALLVVNELRDQAAELERKHAAEVQALQAYTNGKAALQAQTEQLQADIKSIAFNNNLMKKLKALKPTITDHLWGTVLASVSTFFTQIRGEASVVSKEAAGFRINGHSIDSFSGSTLDALAVATRVALTKTFVPHAPFLSLDEPAHGADEARTGNLLGFLASCGFDQVLLATHDPLSDAVADNVILLEAA